LEPCIYLETVRQPTPKAQTPQPEERQKSAAPSQHSAPPSRAASVKDTEETKTKSGGTVDCQ